MVGTSLRPHVQPEDLEVGRLLQESYNLITKGCHERYFFGGAEEVNGVNYGKLSIKIHQTKLSGWPLVGNEGMKLYMVMMGIHSFIPY